MVKGFTSKLAGVNYYVVVNNHELLQSNKVKLNVTVFQPGFTVGSSAAEYRRFADRSCWNRSPTDDAFWYHTST